MLIPKGFNLCLTYAADLVAGILNAIEAKQHQTIYNTISQTNVSLHDVVTSAAAILNKIFDFVEATDALLEKNKINFSVFPLFVPFNFTIERANWLNDFSVSPVDFNSTVADTIEYHENLGWTVPKAGMTIDKEKEILSV